MPRTRAEIESLLDRLNSCTADDLESQDLDFKAWDVGSLDGSVRTAVSPAVWMANGGGGTIVFGVSDRRVGRKSAILGVPADVSVDRLKLAVYDQTDPKLTPGFEVLRVPEGTGRLLLMHVHPGIPPYTDTAGRGTIRVGKDCKPLTGTLRRKLLEGTGEGDYTAAVVNAPLSRVLSASAMEALREAAKRERALDDLLELGDHELLGAVGVLRDGRPTRAALLLAGSSAAIREHVPCFVWTHVRMSSSTDYSDRVDGSEAIPVAMARIVDRIMADNPIETVRQGMYHFEYRAYPEVVLREALLNAFCHGDYRVATPVLVKQYPDRIAIANPGGLVGGITPENILHHEPQARNPCLVDALVRLRLVNRTNLGMERMYKALLMEGKSPPVIVDIGEAVRLTIRASKLSFAFRSFVAEEADGGVYLGVDHLLLLRHLAGGAKIDLSGAAALCQRRESEARAILAEMESDLGYVAGYGAGATAYWRLLPEIRARLVSASAELPELGGSRDELKAMALDLIRQRAEDGDPAANLDVRRATGLNRQQVLRLIHGLRDAGTVVIMGQGRAARYLHVEAPGASK